MRRAALVLVVVLAGLAGCHPRLSMGTDMSAKLTGPLAHLQAIPRLTALTSAPAPAPPEGRNYSAGIAFGDHRMSLGLRFHANNLSGSTLDPMAGPQYVSAAAAIDMRCALISYKGLGLVAMVAPSRTMLLDTTINSKTWGDGLRYGGGLQFAYKKLAIYADMYREILSFQDGPAKGNSFRNGVTVGIAFQP
jgi:hypothetical protein